MATILQVLPALQSGGVERGTVEIAQALTQAGATALVASAGGRLVGAVEKAGAMHQRLPLASKNPLVMLRNVGRLAHLIRDHQVDIVHARSRAPAWSAAWAARRTGAHFITTYHAIYNEGFPGKRRYNAIMASGERVIAISDHVARHVMTIHGVDPTRVRVIPRGVDPQQFNPDGISGQRLAKLALEWRLPDAGRVVMLPGRLSAWKGHAVLIDALARLGRPDVCVVFVGPDRGRRRLTDDLVAQAERLGVAAQIRIAGDCQDMPAAYALADIVVNASTEPEGFGRTVIEAQAMAKLVLASDHGGAAETIEHGVTGWRVTPGDPNALAATLNDALLLDAEALQTIGRQARQAVLTKFTIAAMQQATLGVYAELIK